MGDPNSWDDRGTAKGPRPNHKAKWHCEPQTLDDLMQRAGPYADATKTFVEWSAVTTWLMKGSAAEALEAAGLSRHNPYSQFAQLPRLPRRH